MDTVQDDSQVVPEGASPDATVPDATEPKAAPRTVMVPSGTVVLAATPIGNVGDASDRLKALLADADIVAAEDTRRLYDLANRLGVHVNGTVIAYHDHNERAKADGLLDRVETGATVLVVSDAGMPTINDPGLAIVRRAIERGLPVTCAPGPSAVLDALALSGLPTDRFCYRRGMVGTIRQSVVDNPPRGEMVLVIGGASDEEAEAAAPATLSIDDLAVLAIDRALEDGVRIKDAIAQVVAEHPLPDGSLPNRKQVYTAVLAMKS